MLISEQKTVGPEKQGSSRSAPWTGKLLALTGSHTKGVKGIDLWRPFTQLHPSWLSGLEEKLAKNIPTEPTIAWFHTGSGRVWQG